MNSTCAPRRAALMIACAFCGLALAACGGGRNVGDGGPLPDTTGDPAADDARHEYTWDLPPDVPRTDADGDTIPDVVEGSSSNRDTDGDGTPDYLDTDSDDDTIPDADEGMGDYDGDGKAAYVDTDSDGDGLLDRDEAAGGTDPYDPDSDDDGASDLVEVVSGTNPLDPADNPHARGDFIFIVPFEQAPTPDKDTLVFSTSIKMADVYFLIDTSASMGGEIANLRDTLSTTIVPRVRDAIPNVWIGVGIYDQCPTIGSCSSSGTPVWIKNLQALAADAALTQAALGTISGITCNGANEPYIGSLWLMATGDTSRWARLAARACPDGTIGYPCFRAGAVPIIVQCGDEDFYDQSYKGGCATFPRYEEMITALNSIHARYVGIASSSGMWNSEGMQDTAKDTGSVDTGGTPLAFKIASDGTGLGDQVVEAIQKLATAVPMEIGTHAEDLEDRPGETVDATVFIDRIVPNETGGVEDPEHAGVVCVGGLATADKDGDTVKDVFSSVVPGTAVCFDIYPKMNETVEAQVEAQLFSAEVQVIGDSVTVLDRRTVYFLVPPETYTQPPI